MLDIKPILQWVTISNKEDGAKLLHQFDEEKNQLNINEMLDLSEKK